MHDYSTDPNIKNSIRNGTPTPHIWNSLVIIELPVRRTITAINTPAMPNTPRIFLALGIRLNAIAKTIKPNIRRDIISIILSTINSLLSIF